MRVQHHDAEDQDERRQDERDRDRQCPERAPLEEADPHGDLRCERSRHRLAQRHTVEELVPVNPLAPLDEVPLHVANGRNRTAEPPCSQAEEVPQEVAKCGCRPVTR